MRRRLRAKVAAAAATVGALALTGCGYEGLNSYTLPGTKGGGGFEIKAEFQNMGGLVENQPVLVNDINVGTITDIELRDWTPVATLKVSRDIKLPANATATIGQTSLLGAKHIQLAPPKDEAPQGQLGDGDVIPLARTHNAPETEDVLASVSLLLNGGGLQHVDTIARELNRAMGGRTEDYQALFRELNTFMGGLDAQKADILNAIESINRLSGNLNKGTPAIESALDRAPEALDVLVRETPVLIQAFEKIGYLSDGLPQFSQATTNLDRMLKGLEPFLVALADSGESIPDALRPMLGAGIFHMDGVEGTFNGDGVFVNTVVDLSLPTIDRFFLTGTPFEGALSDAEKALQIFGGQAGNPLTAPLSAAGGGHVDDLLRAPSQLLGGLLAGLGGGN